jgi:hypothetical protein
VDAGYDGSLGFVELTETELLLRNVRVGSRIWAAAQAFFFMAFLFAFFYLRALNSNGIWRGWPHHYPQPSLAFGIVIMLCVVAAAAIAWVGSLGFGPTDGGYASVFVGWTGTLTIFLLGSAYSLATALGRERGAVEAATAEAAGFVLLVLAGVAFAAFILLYVVA